MLLGDISFDMIICTPTEIFHALFQQIMFLLFFMFPISSMCHNCESLSPKLGISRSKPFRKFKSPLISLMVINTGEKNLICESILAKMVEHNIDKIKGY